MKESIDEGKLKVLKVTCDSDLYDEVTEIGARIQVLWTKEDVQKTGWKPGWSINIHDTGRHNLYTLHMPYVARLIATTIRM